MIAIGCDHGGFALKQEVMRHLDELGLAYKDFGTYSEESCDYPIYGEAVEANTGADLFTDAPSITKHIQNIIENAAKRIPVK